MYRGCWGDVLDLGQANRPQTSGAAWIPSAEYSRYTGWDFFKGALGFQLPLVLRRIWCPRKQGCQSWFTNNQTCFSRDDWSFCLSRLKCKVQRSGTIYKRAQVKTGKDWPQMKYTPKRWKISSFLSGGNILNTWRRCCCIAAQAAVIPHLAGLRENASTPSLTHLLMSRPLGLSAGRGEKWLEIHNMNRRGKAFTTLYISRICQPCRGWSKSFAWILGHSCKE